MKVHRSVRCLLIALATVGLGACDAMKGDASKMGASDMKTGDAPKASAPMVPMVKTPLTHRFTFNGNTEDSVGHIKATLKGSAKIDGGKLVLDNGGKLGSDADISYVDISASLLPKSGSTSIVFWFRGKETPPFSRVLDFGDREGVQGRAFIYFTPHSSISDAARVAITANTTGDKTYIDTTRIDDGSPHMVAIVIDGKASKLHLYIDGKEPAAATDLGVNTLDKVRPVTNRVGRSLFDQDPGMTGSIDELRVYDVALSAEDVMVAVKAGPEVVPPVAAK